MGERRAVSDILNIFFKKKLTSCSIVGVCVLSKSPVGGGDTTSVCDCEDGVEVLIR